MPSRPPINVFSKPGLRANFAAADAPREAFLFGPFCFMPDHSLLLKGNERINLRTRELALLGALVEHPGKTISKNDLIDQVWGGPVIGESSLKIQIAGLRRKLGDNDPKDSRYIATNASRGYCFVAPVEVMDQQAAMEVLASWESFHLKKSSALLTAGLRDAFASATQAFSFGSFCFLPDKPLLLKGNERIRLGMREASLLSAFIKHPGKTISKNDLIDQVGGNPVAREKGLLDGISKLRRNLGDKNPKRSRFIATDKAGYRFVAPVKIMDPRVAIKALARKATFDLENSSALFTTGVSEAFASATQALSFGPFRLAPDQRLLLKDGERVLLGARAMDLLIAFGRHSLENPGKPISNRKLMRQVWPGMIVVKNNLSRQILNLRATLAAADTDNRVHITAIPGKGYRFEVPVTRMGIDEAVDQPVAMQAQRVESTRTNRKNLDTIQLNP